MKKNTKIIVWSIVGLAVATGAFFGIRSLVKKSKARRAITDTPTLVPDVTNSNADVPPTGVPTSITQAQANAIAYKIQKIDKMLKSSRFSKPSDKTKIEREISSLKQTLLEGGYTYAEGKAIKNVG